MRTAQYLFLLYFTNTVIALHSLKLQNMLYKTEMEEKYTFCLRGWLIHIETPFEYCEIRVCAPPCQL
jgi:hypothetical protein